ncbi:class I SAM-dependent methyltransferase [Microvirga roseola]|uniref:class I SAM-dependent methyltransferase n=1 Tax=Microvirga roseola TaxID=2883126 RepID=UPI001E32D149|nr:class I SAM-dependent methyltransferase [Microvirga roseola]
MSINYYERNADQFFADTVAADVSLLQARFVRELPPSAHVLDAGCGSGRDAKAFADLGFHVTAFDAATEMVRRAAQHTGLPVLHMTFDDMVWSEEFDGIWASASLLHVPRGALPSVLTRCHQALRKDGILYTSFKYGSGEREKDGRRFTDLTEETFQEILAEVGGFQVIELWRTGDVRPSRQSEMWLNSLVRKAD